MASIGTWLAQLPASIVALVAVLFATAGWLYAARRQRSLSRKQHTFNALLNASFNKQFQEAHTAVRPHALGGKLPDLNDPEKKELHDHAVFLLNHYEFLAAGIRNGDISEQLLKDAERGAIKRLFASSYEFISKTRDNRNRKATFEHLEWLDERWGEHPPSWWHSCIEYCLARPLYYPMNRWVYLAIGTLIVLILVVTLLHLPGEAFSAKPVVPKTN